MANTRIVLFIDAQNLYHVAREAFFADSDPAYLGQSDPVKLGRAIATRGPVPRDLTQVRVYTGRPASSKQPRPYAAHMKQCATWARSGVHVTYRTLRYPRNWPRERAEEKGIDVALSVDYVTMAVEGAFDIGVIASTDTDLLPAVEYVFRLAIHGGPRAEVMAWSSKTGNPRLSIPGARLWCHWFNRNDYDQVGDPTDYNL